MNCDSLRTFWSHLLYYCNRMLQLLSLQKHPVRQSQYPLSSHLFVYVDNCTQRFMGRLKPPSSLHRDALALTPSLHLFPPFFLSSSSSSLSASLALSFLFSFFHFFFCFLSVFCYITYPFRQLCTLIRLKPTRHQPSIFNSFAPWRCLSWQKFGAAFLF